MGCLLVTGAGGQLASELRLLSSQKQTPEMIFLSRQELDITDYNSVLSYFKSVKANCCINCAAYTAVDRAESEKELAFQLNADAVEYLAKTCALFDMLFIHISTDYVFNGNKKTPYPETAATAPLNIYGLSKLEGEKRALQAHAKTIIIRTSWLYSPFRQNFVKTMIRLGKEQREVKVVSDQVGSPTAALDLAHAILYIYHYILESNNDPKLMGIYHYSNEGEVTWYDFAVAIMETYGLNCRVIPVATTDFPAVAKRPPYSVLDKTKIKNTFGLSIPHWRDSLMECIQRIKTNSH